jgi:hypothetical protein
MLWRNPPEDLLRAMRVPDRQRMCRAYVTNLSVENTNVKRLFETPMPRLQRLHVSQRVLLDRPERFCRFLHFCCCVDAGSRAADTASWSSTLATLSISVLSEARTRPLPASVFAMLALRPGLRRLTVRSEVTTAAVQAALNSQSAADAHHLSDIDSGIIDALRLMQQGQNRHLFHHLQGLDVVLKPDAALQLLPILRAQTLTALHLSFMHGESGTRCSSMTTILAAVVCFTELRSLKLEFPSQLPPSASHIFQLGQLRHLRALYIQSGPAWNELTDGVLCELLQLWPRLAKLVLRTHSRLSNCVVPAIGVLCPGLSELELHANLDSRCFDDYAEKAPVLPYLTRLVVRRAILMPGSTTYVCLYFSCFFASYLCSRDQFLRSEFYFRNHNFESMTGC